jgi:glycosyltransferase involved in cell wall biosynthesis
MMVASHGAAAAAATARVDAPRVMQIALTLAPGGTERLIIDLTERLRSDFAISVCCLDEAGSWASELERAGTEVIALHRTSGFHPMLSQRVAQLSERRGVSVLHCHHYSPYVYGQIAALLRRGVRVIYTEHGRLSDEPASWKRRLVNPLLGRLPAVICAVSEDLKQHMAASGIPRDRINVIYNGIDPGPPRREAERWSVRDRLRISRDALVVGTIARLDPVKDLANLIEAFGLLIEQVGDSHLVIVGDGPERAALEQRARELGVPGRIHFLGRRDDARALLPVFDVYVNSSITEGISLTILEAMAAELPLVVTRVGGTPEIVAEGENGYLVPARVPEAIARAVGALAADSDRRRRFGVVGRRRVESAFTLERMTKQYAALYRGDRRASHVWN